MREEEGKVERDKRATDEGDDVAAHTFRAEELDEGEKVSQTSEGDFEAHKFRAEDPDAESKRKV
jgi:hypothetical protein